jgi:saccharopine dehydrogenase-like NADP-dependent oxidoreductase
MAKTVGIPAAIAADLILQGQINDKGVLIPTKPHMYNPILQRLEMEGIHFQERTINK